MAAFPTRTGADPHLGIIRPGPPPGGCARSVWRSAPRGCTCASA